MKQLSRDCRGSEGLELKHQHGNLGIEDRKCQGATNTSWGKNARVEGTEPKEQRLSNVPTLISNDIVPTCQIA